MNISEWSTEILGKLVFLNKFEMGKIHRIIWISCKQPFLYQAVKLDKYKQKLYFSSKLATYS